MKKRKKLAPCVGALITSAAILAGCSSIVPSFNDKVSDSFTEEELNAMAETDYALQSRLFENRNYDSLSIEGRRDLALTILNDLIVAGYVKENSVVCNEENESISFLYSSGVSGSIMLKDWDKQTNSLSKSSS